MGTISCPLSSHYPRNHPPVQAAATGGLLRQRARDHSRRPWRRPSLAGRASVRPMPDRFVRGFKVGENPLMDGAKKPKDYSTELLGMALALLKPPKDNKLDRAHRKAIADELALRTRITPRKRPVQPA